jgi:uncharacterized protein (DUF433 family)
MNAPFPKGSATKENAMALVETRYERVVLDDAGVPYIAGTTMKVIELVLEQQAYGWSPKELHFQHPYLSLGQIHSALAYYWDHKQTLDEDIARRLERVEELRRTTPMPSLISKLKSI